MNWIRDFVRPTFRSISGRRNVPDNLWVKCPACEQMVFHRDLMNNQKVCPSCGHHMRLSAPERLAMIFDVKEFELIELPEAPHDPLKFKDHKGYPARIKAAKTKTKRNEAIMAAVGKIGDTKAVVAAFDFDYMGGSMGIAVGEGFIKAAQVAIEQNLPFIAIPASGGARMQEGILSLMQMARTTVAVEQLREAGLPYIVVLTDPTTGGVSASFAMLGDIHLAEQGCLIGFAGARVIEQTVREKLPDGFQRAEYLYEHGMVDRVVHRHDLKQELVTILTILSAGIHNQTVDSIPKVSTEAKHLIEFKEEVSQEAEKQVQIDNSPKPSKHDDPQEQKPSEAKT